MAPQVSVVMSTYNNEATVREAVASILAQTCADFEFLIVNDGSTDRTPEVLGEFDDPRLRLLHNPENIGLTRSLNKAIGLASGPFIARQDADDVSMPQRLEKQVAFMREHGDVALLGTSRATLDDAGNTISVTRLPEAPDYHRLLQSNCLAHGSVMLRREVLDEVGGYNEDFRLSQDYDLWLRIAKRHRVRNLPEPLYGVRRHGNRVTLSKLPQAGLYRLLAVSLSRGEVAAETLAKIRQEGIEAYYDHLDIAAKLKFHRAATAKYMKYGIYDQAEYHLDRLMKLGHASLGPRLKLAFLKIFRRPRSH